MIRKTEWLFIASLLFYFGGVIGFVYWENHQTRDELLREIDQNLILASKALKYLLAPDFHDRAVSADAISFEEEMKNREAVSGLAFDTDIKWIYTLVEKGGKFYFSAPTVSEEEAKERKRWYWYPYDDIPQEFVAALRENKTVFVEYSDQWGRFRSIAVPLVSPKGNPYLACADYEIGFIDALLRQNALKSALIALFFLAVTIPFVITFRVYHSKLKKLDQDRASIFFNNAAVGISILDPKGCYQRVNNAWLGYTGYFRSEVVGNGLHKFIADDELAVNRKMVDDLLNGDHDSCRCERRLLKKDGSTIPVETVASVLKDSRGSVREILIVDVDVTERALMQEERVKREKLQSAVETAGALCHELNQPLQVLLGRVELMAMSKGAKMEYDHIACIEQEINRMVEMTRRLQKITKYETHPYLENSRIMDIDRSTH